MENVRRAILETPGATDPELRRRVAAGEETSPYLDKVRRHAYRITDADVDALRADYSEDAILELTLAAALGAAEQRLAAGLAALER
jgi:alkylhydroperoxidase family enzyme